MKRTVLVMFIGIQLLFAANYTSMGQVKRSRGFDLRMTDYGAVLGGKMQWRLLKNLHTGIHASWTFVSSGKEYTWTDPYTGYTYKINSINLDFVKTGLFLKKHFFTDQLANTFAPYVSLQAGPVLAIDTDNDPWANISRYQDAVFDLGFYTHVSFGADFMMEKRNTFTVALGYEINRFTTPVDEEMQKTNWGGASLILNYGKYF
ncbi:MAG: hypothetical protein U5N56_13130 [Candidatus Marinimicrobia bacterium]|nr:hypothetical protein [Candidatus Neomarinimicrobiota bacterium]